MPQDRFDRFPLIHHRTHPHPFLARIEFRSTRDASHEQYTPNSSRVHKRSVPCCIVVRLGWMHGMSGITAQEKCGSILLVMGPHADDLDSLLLCVNLIDEAMLNIDPAGERS